jgi:hypothetical protein
MHEPPDIPASHGFLNGKRPPVQQHRSKWPIFAAAGGLLAIITFAAFAYNSPEESS